MVTITKSNIATIRSDVEKALAAVAATYGLTITVGRITYEDSSFRCKVEGNAVVTSVVAGKQVKQIARSPLFNVFGSKLDMNAEYVSSRLGVIKFVDYRESSYKYPVIVEQVNTKKRYKVTVSQAELFLSRKV